MNQPLTEVQVLARASAWRVGGLLAGWAVALVVAVTGTVLLAGEVAWVNDLDRAVNQAWVDAAVANDALVRLARVVTFWGNTPVVIAITTVLTGWQLWRHRPVIAGWLVLTLVAGWLLNHALKAVVDRQRPPSDGLFLDAIGSSFPSGHAQVGGYGWVTFGLLALLLLTGPRRLVVAWGCWLLGVGIALSRVLLGVHWLSDVVVGYAVGVGWALLSASLLVLLARRRTPAPVTASQPA